MRCLWKWPIFHMTSFIIKSTVVWIRTDWNHQHSWWFMQRMMVESDVEYITSTLIPNERGRLIILVFRSLSSSGWGRIVYILYRRMSKGSLRSGFALYDDTINDASFHAFDYLAMGVRNRIVFNTGKSQFCQEKWGFEGYVLPWWYHPICYVDGNRRQTIFRHQPIALIPHYGLAWLTKWDIHIL